MDNNSSVLTPAVLGIIIFVFACEIILKRGKVHWRRGSKYRAMKMLFLNLSPTNLDKTINININQYDK
jgi:hypothetical protein